MATYYVNPNDEPRACSVCNGTKRSFPMLESAKPAYGPCGVCNGTGRLGNHEAAQFVVERSGMASKYGVARDRWRWRGGSPYRLNGSGPWRGSYRLESEAIAAARAALKGGN